MENFFSNMEEFLGGMTFSLAIGIPVSILTYLAARGSRVPLQRAMAQVVRNPPSIRSSNANEDHK